MNRTTGIIELNSAGGVGTFALYAQDSGLQSDALRGSAAEWAALADLARTACAGQIAPPAVPRDPPTVYVGGVTMVDGRFFVACSTDAAGRSIALCAVKSLPLFNIATMLMRCIELPAAAFTLSAKFNAAGSAVITVQAAGVQLAIPLSPTANLDKLQAFADRITAGPSSETDTCQPVGDSACCGTVVALLDPSMGSGADPSLGTLVQLATGMMNQRGPLNVYLPVAAVAPVIQKAATAYAARKAAAVAAELAAVLGATSYSLAP